MAALASKQAKGRLRKYAATACIASGVNCLAIVRAHIVRRDLGQWAEALLTVGSAVSHPVGGILVGPDKPGASTSAAYSLAGSMAPAAKPKAKRK